jgi:hypothetical protein
MMRRYFLKNRTGKVTNLRSPSTDKVRLHLRVIRFAKFSISMLYTLYPKPQEVSNKTLYKAIRSDARDLSQLLKVRAPTWLLKQLGPY